MRRSHDRRPDLKLQQDLEDPDILSRIAQTTAAPSRLKIIWRAKNISLASEVKLMQTPIWLIFIYARDSWTLTAEKRIHALATRSFLWLLKISYRDLVKNEVVCSRIENAVGVHDDLLWRNRNSDGMTTFQDHLVWQIQFCRGQWKEQEEEENRRKDWKGIINEWTWIGFGDCLWAAKGGKVLLQRHLWCPDDRQG